MGLPGQAPEGVSPIRAILRPDAEGIFSELSSAYSLDGPIQLSRAVRLANLLARYAELDQLLMGRGPGGTTLATKGPSGGLEAVRELPQAGEYRWLHRAILDLEAALGPGRKEASLWGS